MRVPAARSMNINRRAFLAAGAVLAVPAAAATPIVPGKPPADDVNRIGWGEFLARAQEDARRLVSDRTQAGQNAYLFAIAQHAVRLGELPPVEPKDFGGLKPGYSFSLIHRGSPFVVIYWRMEPGAIYPAHNHPGTNVCTICTSGTAHVRNFDIAGAPPSTERDLAFNVTETAHDVLEPGVVNMVTGLRNNVHWFESGAEGAEGLDISTTVAGTPFSFLRLGKETSERPGLRLYSAQWVGNDPRRAF